MNFMRLPVLVKSLALAVALCGCSSDGGPSGTALTIAQGNVVSAQTASYRPARPGTWLARLRALLPLPGIAIARSSVEDIRVSIEGTNVIGRTDSSGLFILEGDFAGPIGMRLERPDDGLSARLVIVVPNGGMLTLSNMQIEGDQVVVDNQRVTFDGVIRSTDCVRNVAEMVSQRRPNDGNIYNVHLEGASVRDAASAPIACSALQGGQVVKVDAAVRQDGDFDADEVRLDEDQSGPSEDDDADDDDNSGPGGGDDADDDDNSGPGGGD